MKGMSFHSVGKILRQFNIPKHIIVLYIYTYFRFLLYKCFYVSFNHGFYLFYSYYMIKKIYELTHFSGMACTDTAFPI